MITPALDNVLDLNPPLKIVNDVICPACKAELEVEEEKFISSLKEIVECGMCGHRFCLTVRIRITYKIEPIQEVI